MALLERIRAAVAAKLEEARRLISGDKPGPTPPPAGGE